MLLNWPNQTKPNQTQANTIADTRCDERLPQETFMCIIQKNKKKTSENTAYIFNSKKKQKKKNTEKDAGACLDDISQTLFYCLHLHLIMAAITPRNLKYP